MSGFSIPIHTAPPLNQGSGTLAQQWLTSNAGSLKVWGLRPHTPPLTMSAVLLENKFEELLHLENPPDRRNFSCFRFINPG
jgi:hypothetical protein